MARGVNVTDTIITHTELSDFAERTINLPREDAQGQRDKVNFLRERLEKHIEQNPGFSLVKMLHAGSVAKGTALRTVNDLDVAVYVRKDDAPVEEAALVEWVAERLREAYKGLLSHDQIQPDTNCVTVEFRSGISIDVVPVLYKGEKDDIGYLVAKDTGDRLRTSVRLHLDFIRVRKKAHPEHFAQVVRFVKWWVRQRKADDASFKCKSFMVELIVAHLADQGKPLTPYTDALEEVFAYIVQSGLTERIAFYDYNPLSKLAARTSAPIEIIDPVNPENNVALRYNAADRERLVAAADDALSAITEARYATTKRQAVECWQIVLGPKFQG
jgi:tRNA nucleotidyltransferase (CCA-adding enzyme)